MTYAPKIQGDFALNQFVVHLALVTRSIAGPGNQANLTASNKDELPNQNADYKIKK